MDMPVSTIQEYSQRIIDNLEKVIVGKRQTLGTGYYWVVVSRPSIN